MPIPTAPDTPPRRSGLLRPAWLLVAVVAIGLIAVIRGPVLDNFGLRDYGVWFLDSYAILAANDAVAAGLNPYDTIPFDILKRRHVYSDWWLALGPLGLTRRDNFIFGGACVLGFLVVALAGARPRSWAEAAGFAAAMLSPPVLLAVNRANNDLVIFALVGTPLLLLRRSAAPWKIGLLGGALVVATGLKYYPVVAIAAVALLVRPARRALWLGGGALVAALAVLWSERTSLARGMFAFPDSVYLFGSPVIWRDLGLSRGPMLALSAGAIALLAWLFVRSGLTRGLGDEKNGAAGERWAFTVGALLLIGCFLAGTSFAYRWVFSLWLLPWLWSQATCATTTSRPTAARLAVGLLLLSLWQDGLYCLALNLWFHEIPPYLETVWRYVTQPVNWLLLAFLAGWILDAAHSAAREMRALYRHAR